MRMSGEVSGLKHSSKWTRMTEREVRCDGVASSGAGIGASALVVPMGFGRERLADMMRAVDQPTRGGAGDCFDRIGLGPWRRIEKGYFGNFTKYRLCDFWLNRGAGRRMVKRFRSKDDGDGALKSMRKCPVCVGP